MGRLSFKWKVLFIIMLACFVTSLASSALFLYFDHIAFKQTVMKEFSSLVENLSFKVRVAITREDDELLQRLVREVREDRSVVASGVFDAEGKSIANYERPGSGEYQLAAPRATSFTDEFLTQFVPIKGIDDELLGTLYVKASLAERFEGRVEHGKGIVAAVMMLACFTALVVSLRLQKVVSDPIIKLSRIASEVSEKKDFSLRADSDRPDEIGDLMRSFNEMLENIENRQRDLQKARAETEEINRTLEDKVEKRTAELAGLMKEAQEAREAAEQASRTKDAFLANMSHELRTPLNAIIGYSEMLKEEAEDLGEDVFTQDLDKIHGAGKHLLGLISDILDISKIESGKMELFVEKIEISEMVKEVCHTIQPLVEKNSNVLEVECPDGLGSMEADLTKLKQTIFNLLSNASKFTKEGAVSLKVEREKADDGNFVLF